jgi:hypothetical protein
MSAEDKRETQATVAASAYMAAVCPAATADA